MRYLKKIILSIRSYCYLFSLYFSLNYILKFLISILCTKEFEKIFFYISVRDLSQKFVLNIQISSSYYRIKRNEM